MHLKELTLANGVSGNETEVRNLIAGLLKAADCEYRVDPDRKSYRAQQGPSVR